MASTRLGVPVGSLTVSKGVVSGGGKTVSYGDLIGGKLFNVTIPANYNLAPIPSFFGGPATAGGGLAPGAPGTKPATAYALVGKAPGPPRIDIPAKVLGTYTYVHNIRIPGMIHARVVRPRGQGAFGDGTAPKLLSIDPSTISHIPNVKVIQKNNFLAVVAPKEYDAIQAAAQLKVTWAPMPPLPGVGNLWGQMRSQDKSGQTLGRAVQQPWQRRLGNRGSAHTVSQTYKFHYNGHVPIGPSCSVADVTSGGARIYTNSQDCYNTRGLVASALGLAGLNLPVNEIRVTYSEGSSVYGFSPYDDCTTLCSRDLLPRRCAGAVAVHALGRARLGQLRARTDDGRAGRSRLRRQHHRHRLQPLLDPAQGNRLRRAGSSVHPQRHSGSTSSTRRTWARSTRSRTSGSRSRSCRS